MAKLWREKRVERGFDEARVARMGLEVKNGQKQDASDLLFLRILRETNNKFLFYSFFTTRTAIPCISRCSYSIS